MISQAKIFFLFVAFNVLRYNVPTITELKCYMFKINSYTLVTHISCQDIDYFHHLRKLLFSFPSQFPSPRPSLLWVLSPWISLIYFRTSQNGIIEQMLFYSWLLLPSMMFLSIIYVIACVSTSFFSLLFAIKMAKRMLWQWPNRSEWWVWVRWHSDLEISRACFKTWDESYSSLCHLCDAFFLVGWNSVCAADSKDAESSFCWCQYIGTRTSLCPLFII